MSSIDNAVESAGCRVATACTFRRAQACAALEALGDGVITTDAAGSIGFANAAALALLGERRDVFLAGRQIAEAVGIIDPDTAAPIPVQALPSSREDGSALALVRADGSHLPIQATAATIGDGGGGEGGLIVVLRDASQTCSLIEQLDWQRTHDPLTGLVNRAEFERRLATALSRWRNLAEPSCVAIIDLDRFKIVNDLYGHVVGDQILGQVASLLLARLRRSDTLARLAGDDFGLILDDCAPDKGLEVVQQLQRLVQEWRLPWDGKDLQVSVSIGFVPLVYHFPDAGSVTAAAETMCLAAKEQGPNAISRYEIDDEALSDRKGPASWAETMRRALDQDRFMLYCQRYLNLIESDPRAHCELLVRMLDDGGRLVSPGVFIPVAERYNLMPRLDRWVIRNAFAIFAVQGDADRDCWSINLSGQSLSDRQLFEFILDQARVHDIPPHAFCFEITETAAINNMNVAIELTQKLKKVGFSFSLDDFGSGLSSFAYLKSLPVDHIKIDGTFVRTLATNAVDLAVVKAIRDVAHAMGVKTIAEFVEDEVTLQQLRELHVDYAQGYVIDKPHSLLEPHPDRPVARHLRRAP